MAYRKSNHLFASMTQTLKHNTKKYP